MTDETMRAEFEAWGRDRPLDMARQGQTYRFHYTLLAWDAWQAACEACAKACEMHGAAILAAQSGDESSDINVRLRTVVAGGCDPCADACRDLAR